MVKERENSEERNRRRARKKKRAEKRSREEDMSVAKTERKRHKKSKKMKEKKEVSAGAKRPENLGTSLPSIKSIRRKSGAAEQAESSRKVIPFSALEKEVLITEYLRKRDVLMNRGELFFSFQLYVYVLNKN